MNKDLKFLLKRAFDSGIMYEATLSEEFSFDEFIKQVESEQLSIYSVSGMLPLSKFKKEVEAYEIEQKTHPVERTPERIRTILCATHWCKKIAERLTKP